MNSRGQDGEQLLNRGTVRYGEPHYRDSYENYVFSPEHPTPTTNGVWVDTSRLRLVAHVGLDGTIGEPIEIEHPEGQGEITWMWADGDDLWIVIHGAVIHLDAATGEQRFARVNGAGLAIGLGYVWTVDRQTLVRIDPHDMSTEAFTQVGITHNIQAAHGSVWALPVSATDPHSVRRFDPATGELLSVFELDGHGNDLLDDGDHIIARVWVGTPHLGDLVDTLVAFDHEGNPITERTIEPTGAPVAARSGEIWVGHDSFAPNEWGLPSSIRRITAEGEESLIDIPGTVDQMSATPTTVWGRFWDQKKPRWDSGVIVFDNDGGFQITDLSGVDVEPYLPPPPAPIDPKQVEQDLRERLSASLFGGWIRGAVVDEVRLDGSFPKTEVVALFHAEAWPGVQFGRRQRVWEDSGEFSGVIDVMDVNLMEDADCGGLRREPTIGPDGICWI